MSVAECNMACVNRIKRYCVQCCVRFFISLCD